MDQQFWEERLKETGFRDAEHYFPTSNPTDKLDRQDQPFYFRLNEQLLDQPTVGLKRTDLAIEGLYLSGQAQERILEGVIQRGKEPLPKVEKATVEEVGETFEVGMRKAYSVDWPVIWSTWYQSSRRDPIYRKTPRDLYQDVLGSYIASFLQRNGQILIACNPEDPDIVYGWVAYEPVTRLEIPLIHYVYVKKMYRRLGLATAILSKIGVDKDGQIFCNRFYWRMNYFRHDFIMCPGVAETLNDNS